MEMRGQTSPATVEMLIGVNVKIADTLEALAKLFRTNEFALGELNQAREKRQKLNKLADFGDFCEYVGHLGHHAESLTLLKCKCTKFDLKLRRMKIVCPAGLYSVLALRQDFLERLASDFSQVPGAFRVTVVAENDERF